MPPKAMETVTYQGPSPPVTRNKAKTSSQYPKFPPAQSLKSKGVEEIFPQDDRDLDGNLIDVMLTEEENTVVEKYISSEDEETVIVSKPNSPVVKDSVDTEASMLTSNVMNKVTIDVSEKINKLDRVNPRQPACPGILSEEDKILMADPDFIKSQECRKLVQEFKDLNRLPLTTEENNLIMSFLMEIDSLNFESIGAFLSGVRAVHHTAEVKIQTAVKEMRDMINSLMTYIRQSQDTLEKRNQEFLMIQKSHHEKNTILSGKSGEKIVGVNPASDTLNKGNVGLMIGGSKKTTQTLSERMNLDKEVIPSKTDDKGKSKIDVEPEKSREKDPVSYQLVIGNQKDRKTAQKMRDDANKRDNQNDDKGNEKDEDEMQRKLDHFNWKIPSVIWEFQELSNSDIVQIFLDPENDEYFNGKTPSEIAVKKRKLHGLLKEKNEESKKMKKSKATPSRVMHI
ncbi:TPA_asm: protein 2 [Arceuthobium virus 8]|uniref:Protein 2 n=1 Tax=Arceuthobium virus 8 TaxID=2977953 RepID=A0A9N6YJ89_9RHAB|nr:TPA_asm: protein 2 [Arceuthobium virus 8]